MKYLICKNNFVSFLTAVYDSYYDGNTIDTISIDYNDVTLFDISSAVSEDILKAKRVRSGIISRYGKDVFDEISSAYRSNNIKKEAIIFEYLKLLFKKGKAVKEMFGQSCVVDFVNLYNNVFSEVHKLQGFVRLQEMSNGIYYSFYSSDNDVLELLMPKLVPRFNTQKFILHDYKRCKMAFFDGIDVKYSIAPEQVEIELSQAEVMFQSLYKQYHENVSIKERENIKLQNRFLSKKYRHFMTEF